AGRADRDRSRRARLRRDPHGPPARRPAPQAPPAGPQGQPRAHRRRRRPARRLVAAGVRDALRRRRPRRHAGLGDRRHVRSADHAALEAGPFGPWVTSTDDEPTSPPAVPPAWRTGTAIDESTPIYLALALASPPKPHGPLAPAEVDAMDISVVAALLGVGAPGSAPPVADPAALTRQRMLAAREGRTLTWEDLSP